MMGSVLIKVVKRRGGGGRKGRKEKVKLKCAFTLA